MTERFVATYRTGLRWWRSRSLAAQLVLTNLGVVLLWAATTRQIVSLQMGRREAAEDAAARAGAAVLVTAQIEPALVTLATGQRGFALTGDSAFLAPYRRGQAEIATTLDSLAKLARNNEALTVATSNLDKAIRAWAEAASRQVAGRIDSARRD